MQLLSRVGLSEARLMMQSPDTLSDGQRYRLRMAIALAKGYQWIMADEFAAVMDRPLAKCVAASVRKIATRDKVGVMVATTHDDLDADLSPDVIVRCRVGCPPVIGELPSPPEMTDIPDWERYRPHVRVWYGGWWKVEPVPSSVVGIRWRSGRWTRTTGA